MYGVIKITVCKKRNRCKNKDSEAGHSYNGLGSGKQCGGDINPSNEATKDTNCNGKQSKELHSGEIWRPHSQSDIKTEDFSNSWAGKDRFKSAAKRFNRSAWRASWEIVGTMWINRRNPFFFFLDSILEEFWSQCACWAPRSAAKNTRGCFVVGCVSFERCSWGHSQSRMMITIFTTSSQGKSRQACWVKASGRQHGLNLKTLLQTDGIETLWWDGSWSVFESPNWGPAGFVLYTWSTRSSSGFREVESSCCITLTSCLEWLHSGVDKAWNGMGWGLEYPSQSDFCSALRHT